MPTDQERIDYLQWLTEQHQYTGKVLLRASITGRGWRLHETGKDAAFESVRNAIDDAMAKNAALPVQRAEPEGTPEELPTMSKIEETLYRAAMSQYKGKVATALTALLNALSGPANASMVSGAQDPRHKISEIVNAYTKHPNTDEAVREWAIMLFVNDYFNRQRRGTGEEQ